MIELNRTVAMLTLLIVFLIIVMASDYWNQGHTVIASELAISALIAVFNRAFIDEIVGDSG